MELFYSLFFKDNLFETAICLPYRYRLGVEDLYTARLRRSFETTASYLWWPIEVLGRPKKRHATNPLEFTSGILFYVQDSIFYVIRAIRTEQSNGQVKQEAARAMC